MHNSRRFEEAYSNGPRPLGRIVSTSAAAVQPEEVSWLWSRRVPFGKLTMFDGDPDQGKSVVTMDIAARVSMGLGFPDGSTCEPANVGIVNVEDGVADTIVPRLIAHGADLDRIEIIDGIPDASGGTRMLDIPADVPALEEFVRANDLQLLVVDPVLTMLGGDANKDQASRKALAPLADMADRTGCAIVAVRHLNKSVGLKAIQRGGGNMGLIGVARAGAFFATDPGDDARRIMAPHKSNLAQKPPSLVYRIVSSEVVRGDTTLRDIARVEWVGTSEYDANGLAADAGSPPDKSELDEAKEFLCDELADGPVWAKQVKKDARDAGVTERTLLRAKAVMRVKSEKIGTEGWVWSLPGSGDPPPGPDPDEFRRREDCQEDRHGQPLGNVGNVGNLPINKGDTQSNTRCKVEDCQGCQDCQAGEHCQVTNGSKRQRLTEEQARQAQKLIAEGMKASWAREEVLRSTSVHGAHAHA